MATLTLRPDSAGDDTLWTPNTGANYAAVDEAVSDDDTTYVARAGTEVDDLYNLATDALLTGATISNVTIYASAKYVESGTGTLSTSPTLKLGCKAGGTEYWDTGDTITSSYAQYSHSLDLNPADSAAWEKADIDALQVGIRSAQTTGTGSKVRVPRVTQVWIVVTYTISYTLTCEYGSFAASGQNANLSACRKQVCEHVSFSLAGQDAILSYSEEEAVTYTLTCDAGSFTLTGQDAGVLAARKLTLEYGRFLIYGGGFPTLLDDLSAYYDLEEESGTRIDAHGTNNLTDGNTVTRADGIAGYSAQFTATNSEYLYATSNTALSVYGTSFTVAAWVYIDSKGANRPIIARETVSTTRDYILLYLNSTDRFKFDIYTTGGTLIATVSANSFGSPSLGSWNYVVAWHDIDADTINIQVNNGAIDSVATGGGNTADTSAIFYIGGRPGAAQYHNGRIDGCGVWKRVLTSIERSQLYNSGSGLNYTAINPSGYSARKTIATASGRWFGRAATKVINGVVAMVYYESSAHVLNDGELHIRFSDDYGNTWSDEDKYIDGTSITGFPMNPPDCAAGQDAGEPWLYVAPSGNLLLHMWRVDYNVDNDGTYQSRSTDGGLTWSTPAQIDFTGITDDTLVFATDDDFVYDGVIYAAARVYQSAATSPGQAILIKSTNDGVAWEKVSVICDFSEAGGQGSQEAGIEYLGSNIIIAMIRDNAHVASYKRVSTDMGATWGSLINVTSTVGIAGRQRVYTLAHFMGESNWWTDTNLIMVGFEHQVSGSTWGRRNCYWLSYDSGDNWSSPFYLDISAEDGGYGDVFYYPGFGRWVFVTNYGNADDSDLIQYDIEIFTNLYAQRKLTAEAGSYTLNGQDAALVAARKLTAEYGGYTLTGQDAALTVARKLAMEYAAYTLTGQDAGLIAARLLALAYGAFVLTGQDAEITWQPFTPVPPGRIYRPSADNRVYRPKE